MIKIETLEISGLAPAIKGMRNAYQSWQYSDSYIDDHGAFVLGERDKNLAQRLAYRGGPHAKYRRMIKVYADITAPLYWWKEFDTYKVGTVANSTSTMHSITLKSFTREDFSCEHLIGSDNLSEQDWFDINAGYTDIPAINPKFKTEEIHNYWLFSTEILDLIIAQLNKCREIYLDIKDKDIWWQMIQLLPTSYNQLRTVELNYEVLAQIVEHREGHKLDEWGEFIKWSDTLPYSSEIIRGI